MGRQSVRPLAAGAGERVTARRLTSLGVCAAWVQPSLCGARLCRTRRPQLCQPAPWGTLSLCPCPCKCHPAPCLAPCLAPCPRAFRRAAIPRRLLPDPLQELGTVARRKPQSLGGGGGQGREEPGHLASCIPQGLRLALESRTPRCPWTRPCHELPPCG